MVATTQQKKSRPGYKQTDVGVIPEDWEVKKLRDCCKRITDGTHDTPTPIDHGVPFLTAIHVKENSVDFDNCYFITQDVHDVIFKRCNPERGDVLLVNIGAGVATTALVNVNYEFSLKNVALLKPDPNQLTGSYLNYYQSLAKSRIVTSLSTGGAQPFLSLRQIGDLEIALPGRAEQASITAVLAETEGLIYRLDELIAKKAAIKQGTMQQLLTGKRRLPGFSGEWEPRALGEIATANKGSQLRNSEMSEHGRFAHLNGGISPSGYADKSNALGDTIAISEGGNSCGYVQFMSQPYWCGGHCYSVIPNGIDNRFLYQALKGEELSIMGLRVGSGLPNVQKTALLAFKLRCPKGREEQSAIAAILFDMDADIAALQVRRDKAQALKQGMMQQLLTGNIRLI